MSFKVARNKDESLNENKLQDTCRTVQRCQEFYLKECYYPSGNIRSRTFVRNSESWGSLEEYHENGQLAMLGQAYYGVKQGEFYFFDSTGTIEKTMNYKVYVDLNPMNLATWLVDVKEDTLTGQSIEVATITPAEEQLHGVNEFYNLQGDLDSIQYWRNDTLYHTHRKPKN